MSLVAIAAFLSTALAIYCTFPYVLAILKGKTKPHQFSWLIFSIMNGIVLFSQYFAGGRESVLISLIFFLGSIVVFLLSLKYGLHDSSRWDRVLFVFALCTIVIWLITKSNDVAIWLTLIIDLAATSMTILKIKNQPDSEDPIPWIIASVAYVFTILTLVGKPLSILYVRPLYGLLGDVALIAFIYVCRSKKRTKITTDPVQT
jgi:hypothetical protein